MAKQRAAIKGGFRVLVVPRDDMRQHGLTIPLTFSPTGEVIRAVGVADGAGVGCSSWAFTSGTRKTVVKHLRELADWIEKNAI